MMIEESGENWWYCTEINHPESIQVLTRMTNVERVETIERKGKKKPKKAKPRPFGFAQALPKKGKR